MTRRATALAALAAVLASIAAAWPSSRPRVRRVTIARAAFAPQRLEVSPGDTVEWTNADLVAHSASAADGQAFDSPDLAPRETFRTVLRAKGTFEYSCAIHPSMRGRIVVK